MEAYKTTCPECGHVRFWIGYKTSFGKTPEQLARMEWDEKTCIKCGSTKAKTDFDRESPDGRAYGASYSSLVEVIFGAIAKPKPEENKPK